MQNLTNEHWRLNNLYYIKSRDGDRVLFKMNRAQEHLYRNMHYRNIIPKARQLGMTTMIQIFLLDRALFNDYTSCGVIAHKIDAAQDFFDDKIKFAYDNLPPEILNFYQEISSNKRELKLSNDSRITCDVSLRSGTKQYLHISEYGKMCSEYPQRAREVKTGALNTVAPNMFIFIESTASGRVNNDFYDRCMTARAVQQSGVPLASTDYKLHFYPWFWSNDYTINDATLISPEHADYFEMLQQEHGIELSLGQKYWYIRTANDQGEYMHEEYPSTLDEAFEKRLKGAIFAPLIQRARQDGRITDLPYARGKPVNTFWDLGHNDHTAIWFHQRVGQFDHFINFYQARGVDLAHYIEYLQQMEQQYGYVWGTHYLPHDGKYNHITSIAGSAAQILRDNGFRVFVVGRTREKIRSIEDTRKQLPHCRFDVTRCRIGLNHLEEYRWKWDTSNETYMKIPNKDGNDHAADAFQTYGYGYKTENADVDLLVGRMNSIQAKKQPTGYTRPRHQHEKASNSLLNPQWSVL